jgi:intracellular sulfur oxidation DsrE/DsrF family protein
MKENNASQNNPRRSFLTKLAGAVGVSLLAVPKGLQAANRFMENADSPAPDDWLNKLNGQHKMVFDVTQPHGIFPFAWPKVFSLTNQATGTLEKDINPVVVLRHNGIPYALEDKLWAKYKFGEAFGIDDHLTGKPALRNPFWQPKAGEFKVPGIGPVPIGINELQASGVIFCVCDMALTVNAFGIGGKMKLDGAELKKEFVAGILPGINLVPSGLWAIGRAQEKGCGYCFAS